MCCRDRVGRGQDIVKVDERYFRPTEVSTYSVTQVVQKAELEWVPKISFEEMVSEMVEEDFRLAQDELGASVGKYPLIF